MFGAACGGYRRDSGGLRIRDLAKPFVQNGNKADADAGRQQGMHHFDQEDHQSGRAAGESAFVQICFCSQIQNHRRNGIHQHPDPGRNDGAKEYPEKSSFDQTFASSRGVLKGEIFVRNKNLQGKYPADGQEKEKQQGDKIQQTRPQMLLDIILYKTRNGNRQTGSGKGKRTGEGLHQHQKNRQEPVPEGKNPSGGLETLGDGFLQGDFPVLPGRFKQTDHTGNLDHLQIGNRQEQNKEAKPGNR